MKANTMKQLVTMVAMNMLLTGCDASGPVKFDLADLKVGDQGKAYNTYSACVSTAAGSVLWPKDVGGDKTVEMCRAVSAPNAECAAALGALADAVVTDDATFAMVTGARDACEPDRASGTAYVKTSPSWGFDALENRPATEQDFWDAHDGDSLLNESAARQSQRTAFQRKWLPQIRQCYETADADACYAILTAETTLEDGERGQGYLTDYGCTFMVKEIASRQALNNQPGFAIVESGNIPARPKDKDDNYFVTSKVGDSMADNVQWCNMELRKSGLSELR
jgi:hypothetical protein